MKILQVMAGGKHGGAEMAFVDICIAMHEAGEDIEVVTRKNEVRVPLLKEAGVKVRTLPFGGAFDFLTRWKMKKIIEEVKPDIVQTWMSRATQKTPKWIEIKTPKPYMTVARMGGYYPISKYKNVDYFVANTPDLKRHIEDMGIEPVRVRHINNFAPPVGREVTPVSREGLQTPEDAIVVVILARLHTNKAIDIAIDALPELPNVYLWIAGDGELKGELEAQAEKLDVLDRVRFLGWRTDREELLQAADICAVISRKEPFGNVFVQAWANKVPVIVSDSEGPSQFCRNGEDCIMIPKEDAQAFVRSVKTLSEDKVLQMKLVNTAHKRYLNEFTKEKTVQGFLDYYREILAKENLVNEDLCAA